jgi:23S rRNA pseudouridine2604 synthase
MTQTLAHGLTFNSVYPMQVGWRARARLRLALRPLPGQIVFMCSSVDLKVLGAVTVQPMT